MGGAIAWRQPAHSVDRNAPAGHLAERRYPQSNKHRLPPAAGRSCGSYPTDFVVDETPRRRFAGGRRILHPIVMPREGGASSNHRTRGVYWIVRFRGR